MVITELYIFIYLFIYLFIYVFFIYCIYLFIYIFIYLFTNLHRLNSDVHSRIKQTLRMELFPKRPRLKAVIYSNISHCPECTSGTALEWTLCSKIMWKTCKQNVKHACDIYNEQLLNSCVCDYCATIFPLFWRALALCV